MLAEAAFYAASFIDAKKTACSNLHMLLLRFIPSSIL